MEEDSLKLYSGFETKVLTAFAAAVLVVAGLAGTVWRMELSTKEAARWIAHTHEVLDNLAAIRSDTLQIEFSTQSYRISGDPARLVERDATIASREAALQKVQRLTIDNTFQREHWSRLRAVLNERMAISRQVEMLRRTQGQEAASAFVATAPLKETRERTYRLLNEMDAAERRLLDNRSADQLKARQTMVLAGALVAVMLLGLLAATYVLIRRQLRQTEASRQALADNEESLSTTLYSIGDAVMATDAQGRVTRMNPVAEALTGWSAAMAQGHAVEEVFQIVHEHTRASAVVPVAKVLLTGEVQEIANHTVLLGRDGREHPISDSAAPIRNTRGQVVGVVLVFRDVTAERTAQRTIQQQNALLEQRVAERTAQLHESEEHLRSVMRNVPAMIAYVDARQRYVYVNQQYLERFAPGQADITGRTVREILGEERYAIASPLIANVLEGQPQNYDWQPFPGVWQAIHYAPKLDTQRRVVGYYVLGADITDRKHAEGKIETLNASLEQHVLDLEHASRALRTLSAGNRTMLRATDEQGLLDSMCLAIVEAGGYRAASVWYRVDDEDKSLRAMAESGHPGGLEALRQMRGSWADNAHGRGAVATAIRSGQSTVVQNLQSDPRYAPWRSYLPDFASATACPLRVNGSIIGGLAVYSSEPGSFEAHEVALLTESADDLAYGIATLRARAEQLAAQESLYRLTRFDSLTGLPNETRFTELLAAAIESGRLRKQPFAVLQTNIERLSEINDALGFSQGDQLLREFGSRLGEAATGAAVVARLRGDEFAILLPDSTAIAAVAMVQRVEKILALPFPMADIFLDVSAKIGVVFYPDHGVTAHDLYRHMDIAMHTAKKRGMGHVVFDPEQNHGQSHRLNMAGELRRAIDGGQLSLYLQPKVEMATGRVCAVEGLVRWLHPQRGLVMPGEFISLAEHTGLIKPLTEWVIETGLRLNHAWQRRGHPLPIAVNLSARNLRDEGLLEKILQLQARWGVAAGLLELEITESTVMEDAEYALRVLHGLRKEGFPLFIDDFGTGYSSLSYLQKLPVEYIKIDQSFVRDMTVSKESAAIVRSTIDLAHDLGRKVVAEGVETLAHWEQLAAFGCDVAQGYFIARPMPAGEFPQWREHFHLPPHLRAR